MIKHFNRKGNAAIFAVIIILIVVVGGALAFVIFGTGSQESRRSTYSGNGLSLGESKVIEKAKTSEVVQTNTYDEVDTEFDYFNHYDDEDEDEDDDSEENEDEPVNCADDFNCFISASEDCEMAEVEHTTTIDFLGLLITTVNYLELRGFEEGKCVYYQRAVDQEIVYSEELVAQMLESGMTQEEIDLQLQESNDAADMVEGLDGSCRFEQEDLTNMLKRWSSQEFSTDDFNVAECDEDFFGWTEVTPED